jgi:hypothetical protein
VPCLLLVKSNRDRVGLPPESAAFYVVVATGGLVATMTSSGRHASAANVLLMPCTWLLLVFVICGERIGRLTQQHGKRGIELTIATVYMAQFVALAYLPSKLSPTPESIGTEGNWVTTVSGNPRNPGMVRQWLYSSPVDPVSYADGMAIQDLILGASPAVTGRSRSACARHSAEQLC